jgi:hypothetical protein
MRAFQTTMLAASLVCCGAAAHAQARPACPLLSSEAATRTVGVRVAEGQASPHDTAVSTLCNYARADGGGKGTLLTIEVYWQFARMTYDNLCKQPGTHDAQKVPGLGQASCITGDHLNVLQGPRVLRVRIHQSGPVPRERLIATAKAVLPGL